MLGELLIQVGEACHGAHVVLQPHEPGTPAKVDFPRVLTAAAGAGRPFVLQLEDDAVLAPAFGALALLSLEQALYEGADVLTLFTRSSADLDAYQRGETHRRRAPKAFSFTVGFFIRAELAAGVEPFAPTFYANHPEHNRAADLLLGEYLSSVRARVLVSLPSLVQHRRGPSTLPNHRGVRQSESFRLAFGEVG